ncbi:MAG: T9SS type A sorting domain-containing protein [Candidatus Symbiothrix sp.]|nr:T9SS type A sorting domain-containing protein [Candidatus Symbiothrix sp.]
MKKIFFSIAFLCVAVINAMAVDVSITMNATSPTMTLAEKGTGTPVDVGIPTSNKYSFSTAPGSYILSALGVGGSISNGTIELTVTDADTQNFSIATITAGATNSGWILGTDYTVEHRTVSREGVLNVTTPGASVTANRITFLMHVGNSHYTDLVPSAARLAEGYLIYSTMATITATTGTVTSAIPMGYPYSITVPEDASLFVGKKTAHFVDFTEVEALNTTSVGGKTVYNFKLAASQVYNYRVSQTGKLTHAGQFNMTATLAPFEITAEMLASADPKRIDYDVKSNSGYNVGDIFLNINERGHLKLAPGGTHRMLSMRSWELTDNSTNNYFIEPDFHYAVINENGVVDNSVVEVNSKGAITAKSNGIAIVLVTYDAIALNSTYTMGRDWSAIWPENTGAFVVTVGQGESGITPNIKINEGSLNTGATVVKLAVDNVDAEHDVFYYLESTGGYDYTFKPVGVTSVTVAYPVIGTNSATYNGFSATGVTANADGSYTVRLLKGRNIVKLTAANGRSEYQVFTAKPTGYDILNASNPGEQIQPGDNVSVCFHGLFHPANKMAGIYNFTARVQYDSIPSGSGITAPLQSPANQYAYASTESAQTLTFTVPTNWDVTKTLNFSHGMLRTSNFGDPVGNHRNTSPDFGRAPNFAAIQVNAVFGALPDFSVTVNALELYTVNFTGLPDGASLVVLDGKKQTLTATDDTVYVQSYGTYNYVVTLAGYNTLRGSYSISSSSPKTQNIEIALTATGTNGWDGITRTEPQKVTQEESDVMDGVFEGLLDYYKITSGYELAWFANAVNTSTTANKQNEYAAVLVNDIDLGSFSWTRIGNNTTAYQYKGKFEGNNKTIEGLYIDATTTYQGLFGYISGATVRNLTVAGNVKSATSYVAGIVAYATGTSVIDNCHNKVSVYGAMYVGGVLGYSLAAAITLTNSTNTAEITGTSTCVGGIGGFAAGTGAATAVINNLANSGNISGVNNTGGVFDASDSAPVTNALNTGTVSSTGTAYVAGISGSVSTTTAITNAYNVGTVASAGSVGAIAGATAVGIAAGTLNNTYTLNAYADTATVKTAEAFASGEVTWLLGSAFGQNIGTDVFPVLKGNAVYQVTYTNNLDNETGIIYTNGRLPEITKEGYTGIWYTERDGTSLSEVLGDAVLYIAFTDDTPPSTPANLQAEAMEATLAFSWTASTDDGLIAGYQVYLDDVFVATVTETAYLFEGLAPATSYKLSVVAVDNYGNVSGKASITQSTLNTTGISSVNTDNIAVYPNPFTDYILIDTTTDGNVLIYDLSGKALLNINVKAGSNRINTSMLANGVYILKYGLTTVKVVK